MNLKLLSQKEAGKMLNVSTRTLANYRDQFGLPFVKISNKVMYKESDIEKFINNHYIY